MTTNYKKFALFLALFFVFFFLPQLTLAKSYQYDSILINIQVNKDSTFDVEERQIFNYNGVFNKGWRSIPLNKISAISDIQIIDGETGKPLIYSSKKLDKLNPLSWGKFTSYKEGGNQNIEWYYNLADTTYEWIIKYKVHGGIGFYKNHDEIYWNLFTDYDVPVLKTDIFIKLPQNNFTIQDFQLQLYPSADVDGRLKKITDNQTFYFSAVNIPAFGDVTIALGWPKGLILQSAFWLDFLKIYFGYLLSFIVVLAAVLTGFFYWYFTEKHKKGRGVIIPQYEPPQNLRPAMAEVICKEKISDKTWPATIVDLAVRGYVKIKEEPASKGEKIIMIIGVVFLHIAILLFGIFLSFTLNIIFIVFIFFILFRIGLTRAKTLYQFPKNYIIEFAKEFRNNSDLEHYEQKFLKILFAGEVNYFSTKELKKDNSKGRKLFLSMKQLKDALFKEVDLDTAAFEKKISDEKKRKTILTIIVILVFASFFGLQFIIFSNQVIFLFFIVAASVLSLYGFIKYEARL